MRAAHSSTFHLVWCQEVGLMFSLILNATSRFCSPIVKTPIPTTSVLTHHCLLLASWALPFIHCGFWTHINFYVMRVSLIFMLMNHPASHTISPVAFNSTPSHFNLVIHFCGHSSDLAIRWNAPPLKYKASISHINHLPGPSISYYDLKCPSTYLVP